jgi:hypothetical protein
MTNHITSKLAALAIALAMNSFIFGCVALLFDAHTPAHASSMACEMAAFQRLI